MTQVRRLLHVALTGALLLSVACGDDDDTPSRIDAGSIDGGSDASADADVDARPDPVCGDMNKDPNEQCDDGNDIPGDGCENDCTETPTAEVTCATLAPVSGSLCSVTAGTSSEKLLKGTVLAPGKVYLGGQVAIDGGGNITCVGCDCAAEVPDATVISCPDGVISPGLINTHDHITYTQNKPYTDTGERYEHRHDWREGIRGHKQINTPGNASGDQVAWGELRFVVGGATSTVGSGGRTGFLRNLDQASNQEGLAQDAVNFETFPLDDAGGTQLNGTCNYGTIDTATTIANDDAYLPHISEGIDAESRNEFLCVSWTGFDTTAPGVSTDLLQPQTAIIHGIGLTAADYAAMAIDGTALIWSPRSNITLYGDTAQAAMAARSGVTVALGTDWSATGSMNLLRELACADEWNRERMNGFFSDEDLWEMVTLRAAEVTAVDDVVGSLAAGKVADIAIFDGSTNKKYRAVLAAEPKDVALVLRGGKPLYGEPTTVDALSPGCDAATICTSEKRVCAMSEIGKTFEALKAANTSAYDLAFCGVPMGEPSCVPKRPVSVKESTIYTGEITALDSDGDGVFNEADNCPNAFNPVRPLDHGAQPDADLDGEGDACDVCPLDEGTVCGVFDPDDIDGDGTPNATDNCPNVANPDQLDGDNDDKGDVCDACPAATNPGDAGCPATVYAIKDGTLAVGTKVAVSGLLITGKGANGFFAQLKQGDPGYAGAEFSGIFVYTGTAPTQNVGDRVSIASANIQDFFGQIELSGVSGITVTASGEAAPAPVLATAAEVATGGAKAKAYEALLVKVESLTVKSLDTTNVEILFSNSATDLRADDFLFALSPLPSVGSNFASVTGVLAFRNNNSKLEPRSAADYEPGSAVVASFAPALSFVNVGQSNVSSFPEALTVTLNTPSQGQTFVAISSSDPAALTIEDGGVLIAAGQQSGVVRMNGLAASAGVTLTASTDGGPQKTAVVRVLAAGEEPVLVSLTPATGSIEPEDTISLTVSLDFPAPAEQIVTLSLDPADAGNVPATVTIAAGSISASFDYVDLGVADGVTVTATLDGVSKTSTLSIAEVTGSLVINELDYDMPGAGDSKEFIEIYNGSNSPVSLTNLAIVLVNQVGVEYDRVSLASAGTLAPGQYLVIHAGTVTVAAGALSLVPPVGDFSATDAVQNGEKDGLALIDTVALTVLDKLAYEGAGVDAAIMGFPAPVSLVEGAVSTVADTGDGSLSRKPNGNDTNNAATDWAFSAATPGAANAP